MKILIEISEESYNKLMQKSMLMSASAIDEAVDAIKKGIVLPNGHGDLIDADETIANLQKQCDEVFKLGKVKPEDYYIAKDAKFMQDTWRTWCVDFNKWLTNRPVVIPADKENDDAEADGSRD